MAALTGLVSVADDSGLEVDALNGAPGVYSARYSDDWESLPGESRDARNIRKLLHAMAAVPAGKRACRFVSCMAAAKPNGDEMVVRGTWEGTLLESPHGDNGFGYDPIFFDPSGAQIRSRTDAGRKKRPQPPGQCPARPAGPLGRIYALRRGHAPMMRTDKPPANVAWLQS